MTATDWLKTQASELMVGLGPFMGKLLTIRPSVFEVISHSYCVASLAIADHRAKPFI